MTDATEFERLAGADGATFVRSATGAWLAKDRDGVTIVRGALSRAEAARLYCEDKDLTPSTNDAILARIKREYRPYDAMPEFAQGVKAYHLDGAHRRNPYEDGPDGGGVAAQAWDRGANAAMLYQRATAYRDDRPADVEKAGPGWLARLLRTGRC
jgi:hypothetical protein